MKSACRLLFFLISIPIFASTNKVGNGGDGVFCKNSAQLLDFYEKEFKFESSEKDPFALARARFEKLKTWAPALGDQYLKRLSEMNQEIEFKKDVSFTDIKDSKHFFEPLKKDCQLLQIAIRKARVLPDEKRFLIRDDLWKRLNPIHAAGLLTHEIVYEHLVKLGEENSIKARQLNRSLYDEKLSKEEFWKLVKNLEVPIYP